MLPLYVTPLYQSQQAERCFGRLNTLTDASGKPRFDRLRRSFFARPDGNLVTRCEYGPGDSSLVVQINNQGLDLILGDHVRYNARYYIDKGSYWSFGVNSSFNSFDEEINYALIEQNFQTRADPNINNITLDVTDLTNQIYLQTILREEFKFELGIEHKWLNYSTRTVNELIDDPSFEVTGERTTFENSNYFSTYGKLTLDTYDNRYFPSRGLYFDGDFHLYLFSTDYNDNFQEFSIGKARMGAAFPLVGDLSLNLETEGGFKLGTSGVTSLDFVLGGFGSTMINNFVHFLGYDFLSLPGNSYVKAYGRMDWEFAQKHHLMFSANFANVEDNIFRTG